jgi:molecular chaperone HtpG
MSLPETHTFQTEVQQLLHLMIHSLYSNKEIFLRELISNSSDALDKLRFEEVTNRNLLSSDLELGVTITSVPESLRLVIEDNGIGMNHDDMVTNLGTIANSGTKKFLDSLNENQKKDANLIGQFGVGFYSAFMVAEKITVESRSAQGGESWIWESQGGGTYSMSPGTREQRGTRIELVLKEEDKEFLEEWRLKDIIKKYSNYVTYPVSIVDKENKTERVNQTTPVWAKNKRENKQEEYYELYKQLSKDYQDPLVYEHMSVEGLVPFNAVVYVPQAAPFDLSSRDTQGLHLYVKRVSITDKCKELIPEYLRFVSGVVETDELPLNVSREILQQNNKLPAIRKQIVKKVLGSLQNLARQESEKYLKFYEIFGPVLKEGFHFDHENHEQLSELVRFKSTATGSEGWVSLKEYLDRKAEGQKDIYYITAPSFESASRSPHLEALVSRGLEVLFLVEPIDEWFVMDYTKHGEFQFKSIAKGDLDLQGAGKEPEAKEEGSEVPAADLAPLLDAIRTKLSSDIKDVKISKRLTESPVCLVADEYGLSANMERLLKAAGREVGAFRKTLEVNASHPLIKNLVTLKSQGAQENLESWIDILYETALLAEGSPLKNPGDFAKKLTQMMTQASNTPV